jgi:hypothetical protein
MREWRYYSFILNLRTGQRLVISSTAYPSETAPTGLAPKPVWMLWRKKNYILHTGI